MGFEMMEDAAAARMRVERRLCGYYRGGVRFLELYVCENSDV